MPKDCPEYFFDRKKLTFINYLCLKIEFQKENHPKFQNIKNNIQVEKLTATIGIIRLIPTNLVSKRASK
jgi:hypothetical protein